MFQDFIELRKLRDMLNNYLECPLCWEKRLEKDKDEIEEALQPKEVEIDIIKEDKPEEESNKDENSNPEEEKDEFPSEIKDLIKMIRGGK